MPLFPRLLRASGSEEILRPCVTLLALQISIDDLQALNTTSVELQEGQRHLGPPVQAHRERLLNLLQESQCHGNCKGALIRASALQLDADFSQVQTLNKSHWDLEGLV